MIRLSSKSTYIFKWIIPSIGFVMLLLFFLKVLSDGRMLDLWILIGLFFSFIWSVMTFIGVKIYDVYYDSSSITLINNRKEMFFPLSDVVLIERFLFNFYYVKIDNRRYFFIPHIQELISNLSGEPKSISDLRKSSTSNLRK